MLSIRFDMPLWLMGLYGGIMAVCVLLLRVLLGRHLPKRVFPVLWAVVLLRLFVPFSISSPLSLHIPQTEYALVCRTGGRRSIHSDDNVPDRYGPAFVKQCQRGKRCH